MGEDEVGGWIGGNECTLQRPLGKGFECGEAVAARVEGEATSGTISEVREVVLVPTNGICGERCAGVDVLRAAPRNKGTQQIAASLDGASCTEGIVHGCQVLLYGVCEIHWFLCVGEQGTYGLARECRAIISQSGESSTCKSELLVVARLPKRLRTMHAKPTLG